MKKSDIDKTGQMKRNVVGRDTMRHAKDLTQKTDDTSFAGILRTKLRPPKMMSEAIARPRLLEALDKNSRRPLTLISAPAGYGKTTLVTQWLEGSKTPSAWLSLDARHRSLPTFLRYFVASVQTRFPTACQEITSLLNAAELPPVSLLADVLSNDLEAITRPYILVLDDFHNIGNPEVHELLDCLLQYPPRFMQLVVITRHDPAFSLTTLRASSFLYEIRQEDLRFTQQEVSAVLEQLTGMTVSDAALAHLENLMEGWIVGLHLVGLLLLNQSDPETFLADLKGDVQEIQEYLVEEVIARQPAKVRDCLLKTSILDHFCGSLSATLCAPLDGSSTESLMGRAFIREIERANLFVVRLDTRGEWFRFHHLFQGFLKQRLKQQYSTRDISELHLRASQWFEEHKLIDEALHHALAAGKAQLAVQMVERHRYVPMNTEQWSRLEHWLELLPAEARQKSPVLTSAEAYLMEQKGQMTFFAQRDRAEELLAGLPKDAPGAAVVRGEVFVLKAEEALLQGRGERAISYAEHAAELVPVEATHLHSYITGARALGFQAQGDISRCLKIIDAAWDRSPASSGFFRARLSTWRCIAHILEGSLAAVDNAALHCIEDGSSLNLPDSKGFGLYFLGIAHYFQNDLPEAERLLTALFDQRHSSRPHYYTHGSFALIRIHLRHGRTDAAGKILQTLTEHLTTTNNRPTLALVHAFEVELAVMQGRLDEAKIKSVEADFAPYPPLWFCYVPQMTPIKLLLAQGADGDLEQALAKLEELDEWLRSTHRKTVRIEALSLLALAHAAKGNQSVASEKLREALALAALGGNLSTFVELGSPMADLLNRLRRRKNSVEQIDRILAAFPDQTDAVTPGFSMPIHVLPPMIETLTKRELDTLEQLEKRLYDKEIAEELSISVWTVKTHIKHVFEKLQVNNRRQAVRKARQLGLLGQYDR